MLCEQWQSVTLDSLGSKDGHLIHNNWPALSKCLSCNICECIYDRLSKELCRSYLTQLEHDSKFSHSPDYPQERKRRKARSASVELAQNWFQGLDTSIRVRIYNIGKRFSTSGDSRITHMGVTCGSQGFCFDHEDEHGSIYLRTGLAHEWRWSHQSIKIPIWVDEGDVLAKLQFSERSLLVEDPGAASAVEMAHRWIETCLTQHPDCNRSTVSEQDLPRRLLDLSEAGQQRLRIAEIKPSFCDEYVTLSYCWGPVNGTPWLSQWISYIIATQQSQDSFMDPSRMPKTIQDAITICLALGFRWLWVDCLCILQGPKSDWNAESARMSEIYEGSALTLSASETSDCRNGFLSPRSEIQLHGAALKLQDRDGASGVLRVGTQSNEFADLVRRGPVGTRAWCLQERVLARRVLHYCASQLFFECTRCRRHESETAPTIALDDPSDYSKIPRQEFELEKLAKPSSYNASILQWYFTVEDYTLRNLTMASDKLVALSGLAKKFSRSFQCQYVAGLWTTSIHVGLAWEVRENAQAVRIPVRAPSWSWAAIDGPVVWKSLDMGGTIDTEDGLLESAISVVEAASETANSDPFGPVGGASITISGRLRLIPAQKLLVNSTLAHAQWLSGKTDKIGYAFEDEDAPLDGDLLCLLLGMKPWGIGPSLPPVSIILILEGIKESHSTYRRLGCGQVFPPGFFDDIPASTVRLI